MHVTGAMHNLYILQMQLQLKNQTKVIRKHTHTKFGVYDLA
jgi:hypothetical protein